jgi:hypothetical protein
MAIVGYILIVVGAITAITSRVWALDVRRQTWKSVVLTTLLVMLGGLIMYVGCRLAGLTSDFLKK